MLFVAIYIRIHFAKQVLARVFPAREGFGLADLIRCYIYLNSFCVACFALLDFSIFHYFMADVVYGCCYIYTLLYFNSFT